MACWDSVFTIKTSVYSGIPIATFDYVLKKCCSQNLWFFQHGVFVHQTNRPFSRMFPTNLWTILAKRILSGYHVVVSVSSWGYPQSSSISIWNSMINHHSWATQMDGNTPHEMSNHYTSDVDIHEASPRGSRGEQRGWSWWVWLNSALPWKKCSTSKKSPSFLIVSNPPHVAQCRP